MKFNIKGNSRGKGKENDSGTNYREIILEGIHGSYKWFPSWTFNEFHMTIHFISSWRLEDELEIAIGREERVSTIT